MKRVLRQICFWLGSAVILVLAVPTLVLFAVICGLSTMLDRSLKALT